MKYSFTLLALACFIFAYAQKSNPKAYFPSYNSWQHRSIAASGFDSLKLREVMSFAIGHETNQPRNLQTSQILIFGKEPFDEAVGPFADRGEPTGIIIRHGYIVMEWGEPHRADMTNSVTKSFLSSVVGLAVDSGLIRSVQDIVASYISPIEIFNPQQAYPQ